MRWRVSVILGFVLACGSSSSPPDADGGSTPDGASPSSDANEVFGYCSDNPCAAGCVCVVASDDAGAVVQCTCPSPPAPSDCGTISCGAGCRCADAKSGRCACALP